ncbi:MAG: VCBS repeat-containing protein, partial [Planctomycetes bacterium]|nr:VCBS repeat-containing protein [Planctomycetota bacterium]
MLTQPNRAFIALALVASSSLTMIEAFGDGVRLAGRFDLLDGARVSAITAVDLDEDGSPEMVAFDASRNRVVVLHRDASGGLVVASEQPIEAPVDALAAADFDGDGHLDVALASSARSAVAVLHNDGSRHLGSPQWTDVPFAPFLLAAADFTGDGHVDLVVTSALDDIALVPGNAIGGFGAPRTFQVDGHCIGIAAADFDHDGMADLAAALVDTSRIALLRANGTLFDAPVTTGVCYGVVQSISAGDIDGDGNLDVISANGQWDVPRGSFFDLSIFLGDGTGHIARGACLARTRDTRGAIKLLDANGDGKLDIVVANPLAATVSVLLNRSSGPSGELDFGPSIDVGAAGTPLGIAAIDADGDGIVDLAIATEHGLTIVPGRGAGGPDVPPSYRTGITPSAVVARDLNGDGILDLATADPTANTVTLLAGEAGARFTRIAQVSVPRYPTFLLASDLNGDGTADLVTSNVGAPSISILLADGNGGLRVQSSPALPQVPGSLAAMDVDHDRRMDIVVAGTDSLFTVRQLPLFSFDFPVATSLPGVAGGGLGTADLDGDGNVDLVAARPGAGVVSVLLGLSTGGFAAPIDAVVSGRPAALALGDLDGDGVVDVVVGDLLDGTVTALRNDGSGHLSASGSTTFPAAVTDLALRDMNGDGKLDVIGTHFSVAVAIGDGAGGFSRPLVFGGGGQPTAIACVDFAGDGDVDVATANHADESVSILLNVSPPGILSILPRGGIAGTRGWIRGLRLGSPSVRCGGVPATSIEQRSDDTIVAVAPEGSGTVD